jgi:uncharacterized protein (TIGR03435 family)
MARALLEDRFRLDAVYDRAEGPVYALVMARSDGKPGPSLLPSKSECAVVVDPAVKAFDPTPVRVLVFRNCGFSLGSGGGGLNFIAGSRVTLPELAKQLSRVSAFDRTVVDRTGLLSSDGERSRWLLRPTFGVPSATSRGHT